MGSPPATAPSDLSLDDAVACLNNERRRYTIEILDDHGDSLSLANVAEFVAARQYDVDRAEVTGKQRKTVYIGLYQTHIGKLTDIDAIAFDERTKTLTPAENTAALAEILRQLRTRFPE